MSAAEPFAYHDSVTGLDHVYPDLIRQKHYCSVHDQVCSPWTPVTLDDLLARAAADPALGDGPFTMLTRVLRGEELVPAKDAECASCGRPATDLVSFVDGEQAPVCGSCYPVETEAAS